jgi:hypothetical protein
MKSRYLILFCMTVFASAITNGNASESGSPITFSVQANASELTSGTPVLLELTAANTGNGDFNLWGARWGQKILIFRAYGDDAFERVQIDAPHGEGAGGIYLPPYFFNEQPVRAGESVALLQMVSTDRSRVGKVRFKASLGVRINDKPATLVTDEVTVQLTEPQYEKAGELFTDEERTTLYTCARFYHNFRRGALSLRDANHDGVVAIVRKALDSDQRSVEVEYALYVGILQEMAKKATPEDIALAEEAAKAMFERFPGSWLRAHVYAALFEIDPERAQKLAKDPFDLPGALLLFENLRILERVEEATGIKRHPPREDEETPDTTPPENGDAADRRSGICSGEMDKYPFFEEADMRQNRGAKEEWVTDPFSLRRS